MIDKNTKLSGKKIRFKLFIMALIMFGFGFALIPLYKKICEVTGINVLSIIEQQNNAQLNSQIDKTRLISVELDANVHGNFKFTPKVRHLNVHPGELNQVVYTVTNTSNKTIIAQAVPSYSPALAANFFNKLECFCFKQQTFKPYEAREMPVIFAINSKLPKKIDTITLSYAFFTINGLN